MPDFRVSDTAAEHPKLRAAGLAAAGLWTMAGSWSMNPAHLTDGWVPTHYVDSWTGGRRHARRLVQVGLWSDEPRAGVPGYRYHDWADYQRLRAKIEEEQRKARDRMAAVRKRQTQRNDSGDVRPNNRRTFNGTEGERSANVRDSLTLTHGSGPGGGVATPRAHEEEPPPRKCPAHQGKDGDPGPCRACRDAREHREAWEADAERQAAEQRSADARQRAEDRRRAAATCELCNEDGYVGTQLCDHDPTAPERAARGSAAVRAVLNRRPSS